MRLLRKMIWRFVERRKWGDEKSFFFQFEDHCQRGPDKAKLWAFPLFWWSPAGQGRWSPMILTVVYQVTNTNMIKDHFSSRRHQLQLELCFLEWGFWGKDCLLFVSLSSFGDQSHQTENLANEDSSYLSLWSDTAMRVRAWKSWPRCWSSRKRLKAMFVVVVVVMIVDGVEAVIVMSCQWWWWW